MGERPGGSAARHLALWRQPYELKSFIRTVDKILPIF